MLGRAALTEAQDAAWGGAAVVAATETEALLRDNGLLRAALAAMQDQLEEQQAPREPLALSFAGMTCVPRGFWTRLSVPTIGC